MKHHLNRKHLASALALLLGLLLLLHSCRKEHAVPTANVLASYKGSDKNVLKIIDELKKPENKNLLATLNQQGEVDWQNYQAMLTSDFMQGLTLRFYQGPDSNYFDAQLNPETKDLRLLSKAQKLVEREHAIAQLKAESKTKDKAKTTYTSFTCKAIVDFEYVLMTNSTTASVNDSFDYNYAVFTNIYYEFIQMVRRELLANGFALDPTYYMLYADDSISYLELYTKVIHQIRKSFENALADLRYSPVASGYYINGYLTKASVAPPTCTILGGGGGGGGTNGGYYPEDPGERYELTIVADSIRLSKRFECFNSVPDNASTVYTAKLCTELADENRPGALLNGSFAPGHTFITMTKTNGSNTVSETFGFYPKSEVKASSQISVKSMIVDNQHHIYDASLDMIVNAAQFTAMMHEAKEAAKKDYNMTKYNCTDFALDVFNKGRSVPLYVPANIGIITGKNYGKTPSGVYEVIKMMQINQVSGAYVGPGIGTASTKCN